MSAYILFLGKYSSSIDLATGTVTLTADKIENTGTTTSGQVRLELWLTSTPWETATSGYQIAVDLPGGSNGTLAPGASFQNISATVPLASHPAAGNYFVTLVATNYSGKDASADDGLTATTRTASRRWSR